MLMRSLWRGRGSSRVQARPGPARPVLFRVVRRLQDGKRWSPPCSPRGSCFTVDQSSPETYSSASPRERGRLLVRRLRAVVTPAPTVPGAHGRPRSDERKQSGPQSVVRAAPALRR